MGQNFIMDDIKVRQRPDEMHEGEVVKKTNPLAKPPKRWGRLFFSCGVFYLVIAGILQTAHIRKPFLIALIPGIGALLFAIIIYDYERRKKY